MLVHGIGTVIAVIGLGLALSSSGAEAGVITETRDISAPSITHRCGAVVPSRCLEETNETWYLFRNFQEATSQASLAGVQLSGVSWHLEGAIRIDVAISLLAGQQVSGSAYGFFPYNFYGNLNELFPQLGSEELTAEASFNCAGPGGCFVSVEVPFDEVSSFSLNALSPLWLELYLNGPVLAQVAFNLYDGILEQLDWLSPGAVAITRVSFTPDTSLSLSYRFVPEPAPLTLFALGLAGFVVFRRRTH